MVYEADAKEAGIFRMSPKKRLVDLQEVVGSSLCSKCIEDINALAT